MERLSISELSTYRWSFEEDVRRYSEAGFRALGVWRQKLSDHGEDRGVELLREAGLEVSSLMWIGGFTGSDGRSLKESLADARDAIRLAAELKAGCVVLYTGSRGGHTHNHARRLIRSAFDQLLPVADEHSITLAVEPMHAGCATEWTFLTGLDDTLALLEACDSGGRLKMVYDVYHLGDDPSALAKIPPIASRVALVQLGDAKQPPAGEQNRCPLGDGRLPWREIVAAFETAGYRGRYEIELLGEDVAAEDYTALLKRSWQSCQSLFAPA